MDLLTIILLVLVVAIVIGGFRVNDGAYLHHGLGLGGLLLLVLLVVLIVRATAL